MTTTAAIKFPRGSAADPASEPVATNKDERETKPIMKTKTAAKKTATKKAAAKMKTTTKKPRMPLEEHRELVAWAAACAERVLCVFEDVCPDDARPREAIEAAWAWSRGEIPMMDARCFAFAAHDAAREVQGPARAAARAAGHAFATAHMPAHAKVAATYAHAALADDSDDSDDSDSDDSDAADR